MRPVLMYDADRARLRGTFAHLAALGQLVSGTPAGQEVAVQLEELRAAGAVAGETVAPDLVELVRTFAAPGLVVDIETSSPVGVVRHAVALGPDGAWVMEGWPGTEEVRWWPCEPALLVPVIATLVGLRRRGAPDTSGRTPLSAPLQLVETALDAVQRVDANGREAVLNGARRVVTEVLPPKGAELLLSVLENHRAVWRASALYPSAGDGDAEVRGMAVVDAGSTGLWLRTAPAEPLHIEDVGPDTVLTLVPTTPGGVWRALVALLDQEAEEVGGEDT